MFVDANIFYVVMFVSPFGEYHIFFFQTIIMNAVNTTFFCIISSYKQLIVFMYLACTFSGSNVTVFKIENNAKETPSQALTPKRKK